MTVSQDPDPAITTPKTPIRSLGVYALKGGVDEAMEIVRGFAQNNPGLRVYLSEYLRPHANRKLLVRPDRFLGTKVDALLSLGGDGTFLAAARLVRGGDVPILGVNLGRVGFLADASLENLRGILDELLLKQYTLRRRMLLNVEHRRPATGSASSPRSGSGRSGKIVFTDMALNEAAFAGVMGHQMAELAVSANGVFLTEYRVDGLLISTPTGSTAYALSAGGPIIHPSGNSILLTPMNPASLSVRPLVLPDSMEIEVRSAMDRNKVATLYVDGRERGRLLPGDVVRVSKHPGGLRIIRPRGASYFESLRTKLGWTGNRDKSSPSE